MQLIFFSDLDGTLLDHETYDFSPALPALSALSRHQIPLILTSSKTGPEIAALRSEMGLEHWPAIIENGAGELPPGNSTSIDNSAYLQLRQILETLPKGLRDLYTGFGDMKVAEVVELTGLSTGTARLAQQRAFTEPGVFAGGEKEKQLFLDALALRGVSARDGGRFLTLSFGRTKADGLRLIATRMGKLETVALGDAPNDVDMLLAATQAVIVRNDHAPDIGCIPDAIRTSLPGPAGWNAAVLSLLDARNLYPTNTQKDSNG